MLLTNQNAEIVACILLNLKLIKCIVCIYSVNLRLRLSLKAYQRHFNVTFSLFCRLVTEKKPEEDSLLWALFLVSVVAPREDAGKCLL